MAIRAPSCASRKASPRPIPLLPPVTSTTRLRSDILLPGTISWKDFQYSLAATEVLPKPSNDHRHVIGLFGSTCPFLRRSRQRLPDHQCASTPQADSDCRRPPTPHIYAI